MHKCPVEHCVLQIDGDKVMCKPHWFTVPKPIRSQIWDLYTKKGKVQHDIDNHRRVIKFAVEFVNHKLRRIPNDDVSGNEQAGV